MATENKWVAVVVKNLTATPITITKGVKIAQVIAANAIPQVGIAPGTLKKLDEIQGIQRTRDVSWAKKGSTLPAAGPVWPGWVVCQELSYLQCPTGWIPWHLFLGTQEFGCTNLVKHEIIVIDDEPFKERSLKIPPPMVDGVHDHMKEMLEVGMIHSS